ncbi:hypothetical protein P280DRAFT_540370 [Massarina eburnea CBS 473.64]|uniref:RING-type domain-containing protein n=1 Tax=Massarina eburnea CBS 473.64 TaxID=1395130 RepID=A0A6A6S5P9_9PLEO|nr:hypothetical protein P280DRAFT_540370 [Massarina eburnea CBS 473.64]
MPSTPARKFLDKGMEAQVPPADWSCSICYCDYEPRSQTATADTSKVTGPNANDASQKQGLGANQFPTAHTTPYIQGQSLEVTITHMLPLKISICGHIFCEPCIKNWVYLGKNTCPLCRTQLYEGDKTVFDAFVNRDAYHPVDLEEIDYLVRLSRSYTNNGMLGQLSPRLVNDRRGGSPLRVEEQNGRVQGEQRHAGERSRESPLRIEEQTGQAQGEQQSRQWFTLERVTEVLTASWTSWRSCCCCC